MLSEGTQELLIKKLNYGMLASKLSLHYMSINNYKLSFCVKHKRYTRRFNVKVGADIKA